ncbi:aminotransferase class I/II-fold pyridoxal phosphate-dependent enzyme [Paenibacillus sp. 481]|uniref:aminotransferase class I/II-fold pyridoxal phosphate-dependent enzyme n=1 Tax=Paenibacillus sp. 481 TaxID=2835869 RepID=UPI001E4FA351|nr:aminotransferase class I/II-fold pyridoxal phosphate-dependent enzyme [Paenibacillus sp. 481]UHA75356.1 aminotransferase class I/II-fold pyridoxal phosphate-dependent enzyme [Paenibacillus sp. 481]
MNAKQPFYNQEQTGVNIKDRRGRAPLAEALLAYMESSHASFHVPGHKNGAVYQEAMHDATDSWRIALSCMAAMLKMDVTEIEGTDDLHHPTGVIDEAQRLAADCFGAEETHFLVGGSTVGNVALLMSCCTKPGDIIIVQRNVHKSVLHGLMLAGTQAVFLSPMIDEHSGLATLPSAVSVELALSRYPDAKAVFVTNPNYYGMGGDLRPLVQAAHKGGVPLFVDEAHGAHYGLHPALPEAALAMGADGVVQSTHKMLSGMTMSAMLHVQGSFIRRRRLKQLLTMLQSSSPSYPLMASLDISRRHIHVHGAKAFTKGLEAAEWFRQQLKAFSYFEVLEKSNFANHTDRACAYVSLDPFKVAVRDRTGRFNGYQLLEQLTKYGCVAEMADLNYVVLVFSLGSTQCDAERLLEAFRLISNNMSPEQLELTTCGAVPSVIGNVENDISDPVLFSIYEDVEHSVVRLPLQAAIGYIAAEAVIPYPPGIPLVYRGERLTETTVSMLKRLAEAGAKCHDAEDTSLRTLAVFQE